MKRFAEQWLTLCEKPVLPTCILIPDRGSKSQKENKYLQVSLRKNDVYS